MPFFFCFVLFVLPVIFHILAAQHSRIHKFNDQKKKKQKKKFFTPRFNMMSSCRLLMLLLLLLLDDDYSHFFKHFFLVDFNIIDNNVMRDNAQEINRSSSNNLHYSRTLTLFSLSFQVISFHLTIIFSIICDIIIIQLRSNYSVYWINLRFL